MSNKNYQHIFWTPLNPSPQTATFEVQETNPPQYKLNPIHTASPIAKRLIAPKQKDETLPSYTHWIRDLVLFVQLKKIRFTLNGSTDRFYTNWQPFITHVENLRSDDLLGVVLFLNVAECCKKLYTTMGYMWWIKTDTYDKFVMGNLIYSFLSFTFF